MSTATASNQTNLNFRTLPPEAVRITSGALQASLYELITFSLTVKQAHWNVIGPNFRPIHLHLDEIHADILAAIDQVAERLTALGISPNGQIPDVANEASSLPIERGFTKDVVLVDAVAERLQLLIRSIRGQMDLTEDQDTVTADLFHGIVEQLEKHHWMLAVQV